MSVLFCGTVLFCSHTWICWCNRKKLIQVSLQVHYQQHIASYSSKSHIPNDFHSILVQWQSRNCTVILFFSSPRITEGIYGRRDSDFGGVPFQSLAGMARLSQSVWWFNSECKIPTENIRQWLRFVLNFSKSNFCQVQPEELLKIQVQSQNLKTNRNMNQWWNFFKEISFKVSRGVG